MSARSRSSRQRQTAEAPRRTFTVYTWMLILAFLFISIASGFLVAELMKYAPLGTIPWKTTEAELSHNTVPAADWFVA